MTPIEVKLLIAVTGSVLTILLSLLVWIGKGMVNKMGGIESALNRIEKELSVLSNDHTNLKEEVREVKNRITKLEK